jgi:hypothetical protein
MVWAPWVPSHIALALINSFDAKTLNESTSIHEKFHIAAVIEDQFWGIEVSVLAPCRDEELPSEPSPSTSSSLLSPMMRRE